ncbi:mechanosensitive ion channel family protein [Balneola vulgaris]|jgi:small-conductance mechanosensitive channel|uniref:mechanosensitive ion channel family protein n=1 Tax=Balneola vulgaris TaxID=287535 RepID=UPI0012F7DD3A|nr:mechanosensitive ion channel domain-containing protein [Balneola vulgaris]
MKKSIITFLLFLCCSVVVSAQIPNLNSVQPDSAATDSSSIVEGLPTNVVQFDELFSTGKIISALVLLILTFFFVRLVVFLLERLAENQSAYRLMIKRLIPFLNVAIWSTAIFIVIAGIIDPPIETVLTVGASIGIAVGFAAQDILKNIFGGFIIILDSPFQVGDKIEVDDYYGEVTQIGLRSTRIVTPDDSLVTLPNADIVNNAVSNTNSGALDCQVVASIYLPADSNISLVKEIAYKAAISSRYVYLNKPVVVITENKVMDKNYLLHLKVKAYVLDIRYEFLLKGEITELILTELNRRQLLPISDLTKQKEGA